MAVFSLFLCYIGSLYGFSIKFIRQSEYEGFKALSGFGAENQRF